jgi:hypothetical protein
VEANPGKNNESGDKRPAAGNSHSKREGGMTQVGSRFGRRPQGFSIALAIINRIFASTRMGGLRVGMFFAAVIPYLFSFKMGSMKLKGVDENTSLRADFDLLSSSSSPALPYVSPSGLGTWTFASSSSITSTGTETVLQWDTASNGVRVAEAFTSGSSSNYGLPAIGPTDGGCLITPCSSEGTPDNQSVAVHPGVSDTKNFVVKFTATVDVVVSGRAYLKLV